MPGPDLLVTKFTVPPVRSVLLQRSDLLTVLDVEALLCDPELVVREEPA